MSRIINLKSETNYSNAVRDSAEVLKKGELLVYPTDTVYGIGSDIYNEEALKKTAALKERESVQPYIVLINSFAMLEELVTIEDKHLETVKRYWPGPLTVILNSKIKVSKYIDNGNGKIAVRMPNNKFCLELINAYGSPITSTSANIHAKPQGKVIDIYNEFKNKIELFIFDEEVQSFLPSTIIDCSSNDIKLVRDGVVKIDFL
jgi:L-threonylcarbamoyladenylate synthase